MRIQGPNDGPTLDDEWQESLASTASTERIAKWFSKLRKPMTWIWGILIAYAALGMPALRVEQGLKDGRDYSICLTPIAKAYSYWGQTPLIVFIRNGKAYPEQVPDGK